jgi:histidinol dehydrogenase
MKTLINPNSQEIETALIRPVNFDESLSKRVRDILNEVKLLGDNALMGFNSKFDEYQGSIKIEKAELEKAAEIVSEELKSAVNLAINNIETFHRSQRPQDIYKETMDGVRCELLYKPLSRVGLYIPGGNAPLLSTVLMLAVPAKVAGCKELVICTPPNPSVELQYVLSLFEAKVFLVGGAQAIAAMAFGTETIPRVDKIFGPGNSYVTEAKMQVAGLGIPIDMPAGPSEVLIIADESAIPSFVAADLLSQAEHGEDSQVILISTSKRILKESIQEVDSQLQSLPRKDIAQKCLENSVAILVDSVSQAVEISNNYAPEHLILAIGNAYEIVNTITNAGSVFVGNYSPESVGDYTSGANHTLPTNGFSRNWSGVNLLSFYKTITLQQLSLNGLNALANATVTLARAECLEAHARAVEVRIKGNNV